jgi:hypothetical protein
MDIEHIGAAIAMLPKTVSTAMVEIAGMLLLFSRGTVERRDISSLHF